MLETYTAPADLELLLHCSQNELPLESVLFLRNVAEQGHINWAELLRLAQRQGTFPLLYKHWQQFPEWALPSSVTDELRAQVRLKRKHNFLLAAELIKVVQLFNRNGIEFYAFKGPTLSQLAYGDTGARVFLDLDFFVPSEQVAMCSEDTYRGWLYAGAEAYSTAHHGHDAVETVQTAGARAIVCSA